jgi:hypothetical protein
MINVRGPYMTDADWKGVRHFTPDENWGNWRKVHRDLIYGLDALRAFLGLPIVIHNAYDTRGHTDGSYHYRGMAVDGHVECLSLMDLFFALARFDEFNGIGLYPYWTLDGKPKGKRCPGFHADIRPKSERFKPDSQWMCSPAGVYLPLTWQNLKEALAA